MHILRADIPQNPGVMSDQQNPAMLGGSVLIEVLFGIPGMGWLSWESIEQKDFPTLMALIWLDALVVMVSILLTDLLYVLVDPRISLEGQGQAA